MSIKYEKAKKLSKTGPYHQTFSKIWQTLPESLRTRLTAAELAVVVDVCYSQNQLGRKEEWKETK